MIAKHFYFEGKNEMQRLEYYTDFMVFGSICVYEMNPPDLFMCYSIIRFCSGVLNENVYISNDRYSL